MIVLSLILVSDFIRTLHTFNTLTINGLVFRLSLFFLSQSVACFHSLCTNVALLYLPQTSLYQYEPLQTDRLIVRTRHYNRFNSMYKVFGYHILIVLCSQTARNFPPVPEDLLRDPRCSDSDKYTRWPFLPCSTRPVAI